MPLGVSYMGTKRALADVVAQQVATSRPGALLDVFAGMCSVGSAVGHVRPVWSNDLQLFAASVSQAFFCSMKMPPTAERAAILTNNSYSLNRTALRDAYAASLERETSAYSAGCHASIALFEDDIPRQPTLHGDDNSSNVQLSHHFPYALFSSIFAGSYLGMTQCIEVDSIRFSIDHARRCNTLSDEGHQWLLLALAKAISRCATSTGHFAQPLRPKSGNVSRYIRQRTRSIWTEWLTAVASLCPLGSSQWRSHNRSFRGDATTLLGTLQKVGGPAVVYADPPYTNDQYSRYYHLYETLIMYDYPTSSGVGRYRPDRAVSRFSLKGHVSSAIEGLINAVASLGADMVMSYPANGLLAKSADIIPDMMADKFRRVAIPIELKHVHSTMGGSKGEAQNDVTEIVYKAYA